MSKHTPGPWRATLAGSASQGCAVWASGVCLALVPGDIDRARPNARLIAVSPEMLAALEHVSRCPNDPNEWLAKVRAAIDKAEPKESNP
jgi:hypothetical protein